MTIERVLYNLVGIAIGLIVIMYPFPILMRKINPKLESTGDVSLGR